MPNPYAAQGEPSSIGEGTEAPFDQLVRRLQQLGATDAQLAEAHRWHADYAEQDPELVGDEVRRLLTVTDDEVRLALLQDSLFDSLARRLDGLEVKAEAINELREWHQEQHAEGHGEEADNELRHALELDDDDLLEWLYEGDDEPEAGQAQEDEQVVASEGAQLAASDPTAGSSTDQDGAGTGSAGHPLVGEAGMVQVEQDQAARVAGSAEPVRPEAEAELAPGAAHLVDGEGNRVEVPEGDPAAGPQPLADASTDKEAAVEPGSAADPEGVPDGNVQAVLDWVGEDRDRARRALDAEQAEGGKDRKTLIEPLEAMLGAADR